MLYVDYKRILPNSATPYVRDTYGEKKQEKQVEDTAILKTIFRVLPFSKRPKYKQIIDNVLKGLDDGKLKKNDRLPSINTVSKEFTLSRDTVVKAYNELKKKGLITSTPGKGYYLKAVYHNERRRVFLLFDELTAYKELLYEGIKTSVGDRAELDIYFHHYNPVLFKTLIEQAKWEYHYYIVMAFPHELIRQTLASMMQDTLLLLDINVDFQGRKCAFLCQDFNKKLEQALVSGLDRIKKYKGMVLVFPPEKNHPKEIQQGFTRFCKKNNIDYSIISRINEGMIHNGFIYFVIEDNDLVSLVKYSRSNNLETGKHIGIVSYNDTPFKEIIEGGITVISTDFFNMGKKTAQFILNPKHMDCVNSTDLILRNSL